MNRTPLLFTLASLLTCSTASHAHGGFPVPPYLAFIGFNSEPAFAGEPNTLDLYLFFNPAGGEECGPGCKPVNTAKGDKVELLPEGGSIKLLYCGPATAGATPVHGGACEPVATLTVADGTQQLQQDIDNPALYHSTYFKPSKEGVYAFQIDGLRIRKKGQAPVMINNYVFVCGDEFNCVEKLKVFP